jgi:hypothetical protein
MKVPFRPSPPDIGKSIALSECFQASTAYLPDNSSIKMEMSMEQ